MKVYTPDFDEEELRPEHVEITPDPIVFSNPNDHPKTGTMTIVIQGPLCKLQDYGLQVLRFAKRFESENPGNPCGCKDKAKVV